MVDAITDLKKTKDGQSVKFRWHGKKYKVTHIDDYGVLVKGTSDVLIARQVLEDLGYDPDEVAEWGYMPKRLDQQPGEWPFGKWVGGVAGLAFYFRGVIPGFG